MISSCTCTHQDQDKMYGRGMRVFNLALKSSGGMPGYRCTVCLKTKQIANEIKSVDIVRAK